MIINHIALRDFRRFASYEAAFSPGLNVVNGKNEEGKSTLREAITLALFQDPKTTDRNVLGQRRWGASAQFAIVLGFDESGKSYVLSKDFQAKTVQLTERGSGAVVQDAKAVETLITAMLGLGSRAIFESTVRVSQADVTQIQRAADIADSLQKMLTGGDQDTHASKVLAELAKAIAAMKSASRSNPGPLYTLPRQVEQKESELNAKQSALAKKRKAEAEREEVARALEESQVALQLKEQRLRDCAERFRLEDWLARIEEERDRLAARIEQAHELLNGVAAAEAKMAGDPSTLFLTREQVEEIAVLERQASPVAPETVAQLAPGLVRRLGTFLMLAGGAVIVAGMIAQVPWPAYVFGLALAAIGLALQVRTSAAQARAMAAAIRQTERHQEMQQASQKLRTLLSLAGCDSVTEVRERLIASEETRAALSTDRAQLAGLLAGETLEVLDAKRRAASKEARDARDRLGEPDMRLAQMNHADYRRLGQDVVELKERIQSLKSKSDDLLVTIRATPAGSEELSSLDEELHDLRTLLNRAKQRFDILTLTHRVLEESRLATMASASHILEYELGKMVGEITGGRYEEATVDDKLMIQLVAPGRQLVAVDLHGPLSTGTVEQVYLAARLAIARALAHGKRPPLILDDPFLGYDSERTAAVLGLCKQLSRENQVLLFTCREDYQHVADHVVSLPTLAL